MHVDSMLNVLCIARSGQLGYLHHYIYMSFSLSVVRVMMFIKLAIALSERDFCYKIKKSPKGNKSRHENTAYKWDEAIMTMK